MIMQSSQEHTLTAPTKGSSGLGAGLFLLITAVATLVAVVTRVSANADQPTLAESLIVISENKGSLCFRRRSAVCVRGHADSRRLVPIKDGAR